MNEFKIVLQNLNDNESLLYINTNSTVNSVFSFQGLTENDKKMFICAIRFYTGGQSMKNNRTLAYDIKEFFINSTDSEVINENFFIVNSYMLRGLQYLPIYFGPCTRCLNLTPSELEDYQPGCILTWFQFSSSNIGESPLEYFDNRNTVLIIYSVSGRLISQVSKYKNENEVIFLPFSQFLVVKIEKKNPRDFIYLRQIELGISEKNVLWVDQAIFNSPSNVKNYVEYASTVNPRIRFIFKTSFESALVYLQSQWGIKKKEFSGNFRIIVNYFVPSNENLKDSGVWLCFQAISLNFNCKKMIYTTENTQNVHESLIAYGMDDSGIKVGDSYEDICNFITFK
jgi:hypothetical protein